jgi:hypothetical protein
MFKKILATTVLSLATLSAVSATKPPKTALPYTAYSIVIRDAYGNYVSIQSQYNTLAQCLVAASAIKRSLVEGDSNSIQPSDGNISVYCQAIEVFPTTFG